MRGPFFRSWTLVVLDATPTHNGLMDCNCNAVPDSTSPWMKKLWMLSLLLGLLNLQLHLLQNLFKRKGTLKTKGYNSMEIKLSITSHPPVGDSGNAYSNGTQKTPLTSKREKLPMHFSDNSLTKVLWHLFTLNFRGRTWNTDLWWSILYPMAKITC